MEVHQDVIYARQDTFNFKNSSTTVKIVNLIYVLSALRIDDHLYIS